MGLFFFAGLSLNLFSALGLALGDSTWKDRDDPSAERRGIPILPWLLFLLTVFFSSLILRFLIRLLKVGALLYFLTFPLCFLVFRILKRGLTVLLPRRSNLPPDEEENPLPLDALCVTAVYLCAVLSASLPESLILALGFAAGGLFVLVLQREVLRRSALEAPPRFMQGAPLLALSLGILSLIFSSLGGILLNILGSSFILFP
jgi:electron transport complex protein RnfA